LGIDIKTLTCNVACASCYERTIRECGGGPALDFDSVLKRLEAHIEDDKKNKRPDGTYCTSLPSLHGGEPLLLGRAKVEKLLKVVFAERQQTGLQTNGLLIDSEWIDMFLKYNTSIGISLDGDTALLNAGRFADQFKIDRVMATIRRAKMAGLSVSVIAVLRKHNAAEGRVEQFIDFLKRLADECYVHYVRTNPGIAFTPETVAGEQLDDVEMGMALCRIADACLSDKRYLWQPVRDVVEMLAGYGGRSTCNFVGCDVWATASETPIMADGSLGNCMKGGGARDGVANLRADKASGARSEALAQIDMEQGGCRECKWWDCCHGGCPGEAARDDYRNRTRFCRSYQMLFAYVQKRIEGLMPSVQVGTATPLQNLTADGTTWEKQRIREPEIAAPGAAVTQAPGTSVTQSAGHGDSHGDSHGDRPHGDSNDPAWRRAHSQWGR
jgi:uncharacterized protein